MYIETSDKEVQIKVDLEIVVKETKMGLLLRVIADTNKIITDDESRYQMDWTCLDQNGPNNLITNLNVVQRDREAQSIIIIKKARIRSECNLNEHLLNMHTKLMQKMKIKYYTE